MANPITDRLQQTWLELLAVTLWGLLLIKYTIEGTLGILIHPSYYNLATVAGVVLLAIGIYGAYRVYKYRQEDRSTEQHVSLLPKKLSILLLLGTAITGLIITPRLFSSQTAVAQGITDTNAITRTQTKAFRANVKPENRSLVDWIRTINNYPEPDAYKGQKVKVTGFTIYPKDLSNEYILLSRFVITCCAADAYPIAMMVKYPTQDLRIHRQDSWLEIEGNMMTETIASKRQVAILANKVTPISAPKNPYDTQ
jgi:uncharacterized repeat protein (TIGR03943 family)